MVCVCVCEYICNKWKYSKIKWSGWQVQWYWFGFCIFIPNHLQQMSTDFAIRKKYIYIKKKKKPLSNNSTWAASQARWGCISSLSLEDTTGHSSGTWSSRNIRGSVSVYSEQNLHKELEIPDTLAYVQHMLMLPPQSCRVTNLLQEYILGYLLGTCGFLEKIATFQKQEWNGR